MSVALPTQIADAVASATSAGKGVAGNLLREASQVAEHAAGVTSAKARGLRRASSGRHTTAGGRMKQLLVLAALGGAAWVANSSKGRIRSALHGARDGRASATPTPVEHEKNRGVTSHRTDEVKGRIKESAGAIIGNDDVKSDGKRDQAAASAKQAVDVARDKVNGGIDAVKDALNRN